MFYSILTVYLVIYIIVQGKYCLNVSLVWIILQHVNSEE